MEFQSSQFNEMSTGSENSNSNGQTDAPKKLEEIQAWLVSYIAGFLNIDPGEIDLSVSFELYGLDSSTAVALTGDLEDWLGYEVDPVVVYDYATIETLSQYLASEGKP